MIRNFTIDRKVAQGGNLFYYSLVIISDESLKETFLKDLLKVLGMAGDMHVSQEEELDINGSSSYLYDVEIWNVKEDV